MIIELVGGSRAYSTLFSNVSSHKRALKVGSPSYRYGFVEDGILTRT